MLAGQNINSQMISTGRASLESTARAHSLGLWSGDSPIAP
jgi:hypothetical protein